MVNTTRVIVDCDAGIDDALALFLLLTAHKEERLNVEAVTCVFGNTTVNNVVKNVYRVLELFKDYYVSYIIVYQSLFTTNGSLCFVSSFLYFSCRFYVNFVFIK